MQVKYISTVLTVIILSMTVTVWAQQPAPLPTAYPATIKTSYVRTWQAMRPGLDTVSIETQETKDVKQVTEYVDGLGRSLQSVVKGGSLTTGGTVVDMANMHLYDNLGREVRKYLPYPSPSANGDLKPAPFAEQQVFMQGQFGGQNETFFYGQTEFEASPLNRLLKAMAPGNSWVGLGRGAQSKYWTNTIADSVRIWNVTDGPTGSFGTYTSPGIYPAGELQKNVSIDEHGKQVVEFKDKEGRVVLKKVQLSGITDDGNGRGHAGWLSTYYIYDSWGNSVCVLQPKAVEWLSENNWVLTNGVLDELAFRYAYDGRDRMVVKKVPGAGEVYMVYDWQDRPVLTQDAYLRGQGKWAYTQYDALGRLVATGLWTDSNSADWHRTAAGNGGDYPAVNSGQFEELTRIFYDNYNWLNEYNPPLTATYNALHNEHLLAASNGSWPYPQQPIQTNATKSLVTGGRSKVLGTADTYLYTVTIYDDKDRAIQVQSTNHSGGVDIATTQYAWNGKPLINVIQHQRGGTTPQTSTVVAKLTYDDLWRLVKTEKKIAHSLVNGGAMPNGFITVSQMEYDALGQLKKKKLGTALESLVYDYNIRGWVLGANRGYINGTDNAHWFGFDLGYDKPANIIAGQTYTTPQYNGNISGSTWRAAGDGERRKYDFGYDATNRLTWADFNQLTDNSFSKIAGLDFSVSNIGFDANGNILGMAQKSWKIGGSSYIDQLQYSYKPNSNKLNAVFDTANDKNSKLGDFNYDPATKGTKDYSYDANGSLTVDYNKNITSISYNHLNLPQTVIVAPSASSPGGSIDYVHDAAGNKLKKIVHESGKPDKTTEYISGFVYEDGQLQLLGHEEGRIRFIKQYYLNGDSTYTLAYDYFLKDHLGNIRTVLTAQKDTARYAASFETGVRAKETALFTNIAQTAYPISLIQNPAYPTDNTTSPNAQTSKLDGVNKQLGATLALKVMAGDKVDIGVKAWVPFAATAPDGKKITTTQLLSGLISALTNGASGLSGGKASPTELQTTGSPMLAGIDDFLNSHNDMVYPSPPRAYLNWILFDEQFKFVPSGSGFMRVGYYEDTRLQTLAQNGLPIAKSGYLFVYLSNEVVGSEQGVNVFFDNLTVQHYTGPLMEETQYYPFGLTMAGISSKTFGKLENRKKFNGYEENKSFNLNWQESFYRTYDPQLGRFWQVDPKPTDSESPYAAMGNNPVLRFDILGDTTVPSADGGVLTLPTGSTDITTFASDKKYTVNGKPIFVTTGGASGFTYNGVRYTAQFYVESTLFAYYQGTDGSKLGYDINTIPSNYKFAGQERLATAGYIMTYPSRVQGVNRIPPAYVFACAVATGAALSSLTHWSNTSSGFSLYKPLVPPVTLPIVTPFDGHGNRRDNTNPHLVYEFSFMPTDGRTPVLKYGIADMYKTGYDRPENQLPALKAIYGATVTWRPALYTPNRATALAAELYMVSAHVNLFKEMPRAQILPRPF